MSDEQLELMDSHAHLTSEDYPIDAEAAIKRAIEGNVKRIINICTTPGELEEGLKLEEKYPDLIKNAASTTPHDSHTETDEIFKVFEKAAFDKKLVGIGETGFDDFIEPDNQKQQWAACEKYVDLALRTGLPAVFHIRGDQAFANIFKIADQFDPFKGIIHCFTGNFEQAEKALSLNWYISISGIASFKKSEELRNVIKQIPLDRLLIETDAPWLAPQGYRGKDNEPAFVKVVAETLSIVYDKPIEEIAQTTYRNGLEAFGLTAQKQS